MSKRSRLLESISSTIEDYRKGEIEPLTPEHVERWIKQFDKSVEIEILAELDHVLQRTYISKSTVKRFIRNLLTNAKLAGDKPCSFWRRVKFLNIQKSGNSQQDLLALFDKALDKRCGIELASCGKGPKAFLYLDDALFSGNRIRNDLNTWIKEEAPSDAQIHVVVMAFHLGGQHYAETSLQKAAASVGKTISFTWWRCVQIEDRKSKMEVSNVLRPSRLPGDSRTKTYVQTLNDAGYPPVLRPSGRMENDMIFSCEEGREVLEQELLKAGLEIREMCPNLKDNHRPLGYSVLKTLGFGSLIVTYRNCPNNCPLAFWAGDPWYPLFPRKTK